MCNITTLEKLILQTLQNYRYPILYTMQAVALPALESTLTQSTNYVLYVLLTYSSVTMVITQTLPNIIVAISGSDTCTGDEHDTSQNSRQVKVDWQEGKVPGPAEGVGKAGTGQGPRGLGPSAV